MIKLSAFNFAGGEKKEISGVSTISSAAVRLKIDGVETQDAASGENSLDALFKAFCRVVGKEIDLVDCQNSEEFHNNKWEGKSVVKIRLKEKEKKGKGKAEDGRKAFLMALVAATNQKERR